MTLDPRFLLRQIAGEYLLIPTGKAALTTKGLIALSESGALIYQKLQEGCDPDRLTAVITAEYQIDPQTAREDIEAFLAQMRGLGILTDDQTT